MILVVYLVIPFKREHLPEAEPIDEGLHNGRDGMPLWKKIFLAAFACAAVLSPWRSYCLGLALALVLGVMILFYWSTVSSYLVEKIRGFGWVSFAKLFRDVVPALIFAFVVIHEDDATRRDFKNIIMATFLWFLLVVVDRRAYLFNDVLRSSRRFLVAVISLGFNAGVNELSGYILGQFRGLLEAVISFPGFNACLNELSVYILAQAISFIPVLGAAMFSHGTKCMVLNMLKWLVKQGLVWLLVGCRKNYRDAKTLVDMHVTNTV